MNLEKSKFVFVAASPFKEVISKAHFFNVIDIRTDILKNLHVGRQHLRNYIKNHGEIINIFRTSFILHLIEKYKNLFKKNKGFILMRHFS